MAKSPAQRFPSAGELHTALLSVDLRPDDAEPVVVRQDTPPGGTPPTFAQTERSWMVPTVLIVVLAVTLGVVGVLFARSDTGQRLLNEPSSESGGDAPLAVVRVTAFDPQGDGREHDEELARLTDGDPGTTWDTERYGSRQFGGLKGGVGVILELDGRRRIDRIEVSSSTRGWGAQVFVADAPKAGVPPAEWGEPAASMTGIDGSTTFDVDGREGAAVLLWITDLGESSAVTVGEVRILA
jgi:eukaryotic-like serine/threonine-protein kinase